MIYGHSEVSYAKEYSKILYSNSFNHKYHHQFIHQSAFIDLKIMKKYHYNTYFKIAGDTEFFTKIFNKGYRFQKIDVIVCTFSLDGISSKPSYQMFKEEYLIGRQYNRFFPMVFALRYGFYILPRFFIRLMIPKPFRNKLRMIFSKSKF